MMMLDCPETAVSTRDIKPWKVPALVASGVTQDSDDPVPAITQQAMRIQEARTSLDDWDFDQGREDHDDAPPTAEAIRASRKVINWYSASFPSKGGVLLVSVVATPDRGTEIEFEAGFGGHLFFTINSNGAATLSMLMNGELMHQARTDCDMLVRSSPYASIADLWLGGRRI
jgi:hypothetical protein